MTKYLSEVFVEKCIINWLFQKGYSKGLNLKDISAHGVDIKVRHKDYPRYYFVEVKGDPNPKTHKYPSSAREVNFNYALGQILTRMKTKSSDHYAIAFPESFSKKVISRLPWLVCKKLNLNVFIVDNAGQVRNLTWKQLKKEQIN